jgi:hypothetical protein
MNHFESLPLTTLETVSGGAGTLAPSIAPALPNMPPVTPRGPFEVMSSNGLAKAIYGANGQYVRTIILHP